MNDATVRDIWHRLEFIDRRLDQLEETVLRLSAHIRARLKEEAEARHSDDYLGSGAPQDEPPV